ncbi:MAG TPA: Holliday junction resolvase RuvX [Fimbriimonadales bacterium]|nr:Holliday junction resolvase RuvX [Fimbriimonadales bacterium]
MRILGVDYGTKRIGLAIGEIEVKMAFAKKVIPSTGNPRKDAQNVARYCKEEECDSIVIGLPVFARGEEGEQARITREFGEELRKMGFTVEYWNERYTSLAAEDKLAHLKPKRRKEVADSEAARIMLMDYMSSLEQA